MPATRFAAALAATVLAAMLTVGAASAQKPRDVTQRPAGVPLSFKLPFYWERQKAPRGYAFYSRSDDLSASLAVVEMPKKIKSGGDLANGAADLVTATYGRVDPNATLQVARVVLPIGESIRAVIHYHQQLDGGQTAEGVAVLYFVSHGTHGYAFLFHTGSAAVGSWDQVFRRTAKSIRYVGSSL